MFLLLIVRKYNDFFPNSNIVPLSFASNYCYAEFNYH